MLAQTHQQLEQHFRELARERAPLGYPVYAFEHNLDDANVDTLCSALCDDLSRTRRPNRAHWLLWTTIAAEVGYTYDGEEYWDSFKAFVPAWIDTIPNRERIRDWFEHFATTFNGFQPDGRWADHFSIIAWPITHSILPQYLQSHFARHLYDLRHELAARHGAKVEQLGALLENRYDGYSSRFEHFLQHTALTARLVLALRDEDVPETVTPIFRPTLARIVRDLEQKGSSRGYLHDARRILRDARLRARQGLVGSASGPTEPRARQAETTPPVGLKLLARKTAEDAWAIGLALPNFAALASQEGMEPGELDRARCNFFDQPDIWMPGRALHSYSDKSRWLAAMPASLASAILAFQSSTPALGRVAGQLKVLSRPPWLLRVHGDGIARQVLGNHTRTKEEYLIVTTSPLATATCEPLSLEEQGSRTVGVHVYRLVVPVQVTAGFLTALQTLALGYSLRAHVNVFGLVPRWEEANACSAWLPAEEIILRLTADFPVTEFGVSIDGEEPTRLAASADQEVIASLGTLEIGRHVIEVTAKAKDARNLPQIAPERLIVQVRAPAPWRTAEESNAGLRAVMEPPDATFEDVVEKRATFALHGPDNRTATVAARLYAPSGAITEVSELGRITLPSTEAAIAQLVEKLSHDPLSDKIQSAARIDLSFTVDELGVVSISFRQQVAPLRWKIAKNHGETVLRLINETAESANIALSSYDLVAPDARREADTESYLAGKKLEAPGALFVARLDGKPFAAFASVPPSGRLSDFSSLRVNAALAAPGTSPRNIPRLLALLRIWRPALPLGSLAALRKTDVLDLFEAQIELLACGKPWADKVRRYRERGIPLDQLQGDVGGSPGFASRMRTTEWTYHSDSARAKAEFARLARTYNVCADKRICDLALTLAFHPTSIRLNDPKQGIQDFEELGNVPALARGAYFAKMTSDLRFASTARAQGAAR